MDEPEIKHYSNDDITIVWTPSRCIHSTNCWNSDTGLQSVFNPRRKPWIDARAATTDEILQRIRNCPSGALTYESGQKSLENKADEVKVEAQHNGPLLIHGDIALRHHDGKEEKRSNVTAFCRCGNSKNKPFCDGSHRHHKFEE